MRDHIGITAKVLSRLAPSDHLEAHSVSSLARRIACSRDTARRLLEEKILIPIARTDHGGGYQSIVFTKSALDQVREKNLEFIDQAIAKLSPDEFQARLAKMKAFKTVENQ